MSVREWYSNYPDLVGRAKKQRNSCSQKDEEILCSQDKSGGYEYFVEIVPYETDSVL